MGGIISEASAVFGDLFEDDFVEEHGNGIQVAIKSVRFDAQSFEWNGAASGEAVTISGQSGEDAKPYQERQVKRAVEEVLK